MLENNFYYTDLFQISDDSVQAEIRWNEQHPIFDGHFPGQPIVPGVCMVQIIRELVEKKIGASVRIVAGDNLKFLKFIDPRFQTNVGVSITIKTTDLGLSVKGSLFETDNVLFKFEGLFERLS